jgi:hypothetical protein
MAPTADRSQVGERVVVAGFDVVDLQPTGRSAHSPPVTVTLEHGRADCAPAAALEGSAPKLTVSTADDWSEAEIQASVHYINALALRKRMLRWAELESERQTGRSSVDDPQAVRGRRRPRPVLEGPWN